MPRKKKCKLKTCGEIFTPVRPLQVVCSPKCAYPYTVQQAEAKKRKEIAKRKLGIKPLSKWLAEAQKVFNEYIRLRDAGEPCISCGNYASPQWAAGHYRSVGANPELRFNEDNVHRQCNMKCNNALSGNIINYRISLEYRIGTERLEILEGPHKPKNYTIENAKTIKKWYRRKIKRLRSKHR